MAKIEIKEGKMIVPDEVDIPYIEGDGIGPEIFKAAKQVIDASVAKAYGGKKKINWIELLAGKKAYEKTKEYLPEKTVESIKEYKIAIKGPLATPVGGGIRSLNVALRRSLDLYACVRPVKYIEGVPSPVKHPEKVNMVVFRENTEDLYAGIEWEAQSDSARKVINFLNKEMNCSIDEKSAIGIKPMTEYASKRIMKKAIEYAIESDMDSITIVHKGNIMKYTEGAFRKWCYEASQEYEEHTVTEETLLKEHGGKNILGKIIIKDRIADALLHDILIKPEEFSVLVLPNLNGDYVSDALAAQVGGLGIAPGANIGDECAIFEATHGTAPNIAGRDEANPSSIILSAKMMLEHIGWNEAAELIYKGISEAYRKKSVTADLYGKIEGAVLVSCSEFAEKIVENI